MLFNYITNHFSLTSNCRNAFPKKENKKLPILFIFMLSLFATNMQGQTTFTSVQSGDFTNPTTWGTATAPTAIDNIVIATGTTVFLNDLITVNNVTVTGTLEGSSDSPDFTITGNLTVNFGGLLDGVYYWDGGGWGFNKGIQLTIAGNITNNGRINLSEGSNYNPEGVLHLNGTTVQTVTGLGVFGGTVNSTDNSNTGRVINQLVINNTSTTTPNVIWEFNNVKIRSTLTLTSARVHLGTNKMTIGNYNFANTNCATGSGFLTGTVGRWYSNNDYFQPIIAGTEYNNDTARFPFITTDGKNRSAYIARTHDTSFAGVSGELSVTYYDVAGVSPGFSIVDGTYTVTNIYESAWAVGKDDYYTFPNGSHSIALYAEGAFIIENGNSRIVTADATTVGTHQTGTITPFAERIGILDADLENIFQMGYNAAQDTPVTSLQSGNWNSASTWSNNSIPSCTDTVTILPGHTITANTVNSVAGVNILTGGTLVSDAGSLTVGCTNNNASFYNMGTYSMNGGTLSVNGNVTHTSGSTFNQTGGDIIVDGNNNGAASTSSELTLFKIANASLNLTGGKITIVDPAVTVTNLATTHSATAVVPCVGFLCWYPTSVTLDAVDGISVGQVIVGAGIPAGTVVANINLDGSINTDPSLPATGLTLPLNLTFYDVNRSPAAFVYQSVNHYAAGANHTLQIGDGVSTQKSTITTNGFNCNFRFAEGALSLNNLIVNAPDPINRFVNLDYFNTFSMNVLNVQNDFTIVQGKVKGTGVDAYFGGNIVNNGALNVNNTTYFGNLIDGNPVPTSKPQTISGSGTFNAQMDVIQNDAFSTGSVSQLKVNNTSPQGVTFLVPFSVINGLTMTEGIIHTSSTSVLKVGAPAMAYTGFVSGNFGPSCYIDGPFAKDIGGSQDANDLTNGSGFEDKFLFPVGKSSYTPIWVGVTTPEGGFNSPGTNLQVEAYETNPGTPSANIAYLSQNRWKVSKTAGTINDFDIRVADPVANDSYIIVQAPTSIGIYDNDFGITSTFATGTPNTLTSTSGPLPFSSFKGYFSTARQAACSVVNPGNTVASTSHICGGQSTTLRLQNVVIGEGITYQWQSSATGSNYTDINGAMAPTCIVSPVANTYYRCNVTCSFSTSTVPSTPIQITLDNTIVSTTAATICLPINTATLSASASTGIVKWYDAQAGGTTLGTGNSFTTPVLTATTTYFAGTESTVNGTAGLAYTLDGYGTGGLNKGLAFNLSNSIVLNSVKVYPQQSPDGPGVAPMTIKVFQNGLQVPGTSDVVFTPNTYSSWTPTTTPQIVTLNYTLPAGNNYSLEITGGANYDNGLAYTNPTFPINNGAVSIVGGMDNGFVDTYSYNYFYDWNITEICSSARIPVTVTVLTAAECDLGTVSVTESLSRIAAFPNPYHNTFKLNIQTNNAADIAIKVYDMIGRLIEQRKVNVNEVPNLEMGSGYPSGVYNVVIQQEETTKSLKVIKK